MRSSALGTGCGSDVREETLPRTEGAERRAQLVDVAAEVGLDFRHGAFRSGRLGGPARDDGRRALLARLRRRRLARPVRRRTAWALSEHDEWLAEGGLPDDAPLPERRGPLRRRDRGDRRRARAPRPGLRRRRPRRRRAHRPLRDRRRPERSPLERRRPRVRGGLRRDRASASSAGTPAQPPAT